MTDEATAPEESTREETARTSNETTDNHDDHPLMTDETIDDSTADGNAEPEPEPEPDEGGKPTDGSLSFTRRSALAGIGFAGLLGLGATTATAAEPAGQVGAEDRPLSTLYTQEIRGSPDGEVPFDVHFGDTRALRIQGPTTLELEAGDDVVELEVAPSVVVGQLNEVDEDAGGATVGGGGAYAEVDDTELDLANVVTSALGTVGGGGGNRAGDDDDDPMSASFATVGGGEENEASDAGATVAGGSDNTASGESSAIGGGRENEASGAGSAVGGGVRNEAVHSTSAIGGGLDNEARDSQTAVGGGLRNSAWGYGSTIAGGQHNATYGVRATIGGGGGIEQADGNVAGGDHATIPGGRNNRADGDDSFAAGRNATADHDGAFVWSDGGDEGVSSTGEDQFIIDAGGGVGIGTDSPAEKLHVRPDADSVALALQNSGGGSGTDEGGWGIGTGHHTDHLNFYWNEDVGDSWGGYTARITTDGEFVSSSDRRLKSDVESLEGVLEDVRALRPRRYRFDGSDRPSFGFIAQEVRELFPELVHEDDGEEGLLSLAYDQFAALAIGAIQEQQEELDDLRAENDELHERVAAIERRLELHDDSAIERGGDRR